MLFSIDCDLKVQEMTSKRPAHYYFKILPRGESPRNHLEACLSSTRGYGYAPPKTSLFLT